MVTNILKLIGAMYLLCLIMEEGLMVKITALTYDNRVECAINQTVPELKSNCDVDITDAWRITCIVATRGVYALRRYILICFCKTVPSYIYKYQNVFCVHFVFTYVLCNVRTYCIFGWTQMIWCLNINDIRLCRNEFHGAVFQLDLGTTNVVI